MRLFDLIELSSSGVLTLNYTMQLLAAFVPLQGFHVILSGANFHMDHSVLELCRKFDA